MEASRSATQLPMPTPRRRLGDGGITVRYLTTDAHASPEARGWRHRGPLPNYRFPRLYAATSPPTRPRSGDHS